MVMPLGAIPTTIILVMLLVRQSFNQPIPPSLGHKMNLYNIDCKESYRSIPDKHFALVLSDPPYDGQVNMTELVRICKGHIILFCAPENQFFKPDELAYWVKPSSTKNYGKHLGRFVELILIKRQGNTFNSDLHWSNYTGVYDDRVMEKSIHPYQKPLALIERLVRIYSVPGDMVYDPYMGSGTCGEACLRSGRVFTGVEKDETFFNLALKRLTP
jgi:DNA modification methylase